MRLAYVETKLTVEQGMIVYKPLILFSQTRGFFVFNSVKLNIIINWNPNDHNGDFD